MKIVWVLPTIACSGGIRIVVEYANRLQQLGHDAYVACLRPIPDKEPCFPLSASLFVGNNIDEVTCNADAVVATGNETVDSVMNCKTSGRRYHFIQNRESLFLRKPSRARRVEKQFELPIIPITISHWLEEVIRLYGKESFVIHNGLDVDLFKETPGIRSSNYRVIAEGHGDWAPWKRLGAGIQAARMSGADDVWALTLSNAPAGADKVLSHVSSEEVAKAYSSASVMVKLSDFEGYPAPQAEAMACGCAVVTAAGTGTIEYCVDGVNSLVVPLRDVDAAAEALVKLKDPELRNKLVEGGRRTISEMFKWDDKAKMMEIALSGKAVPSDMPCPFHTKEQQEEIIAASYPYTLPYWNAIKVLGKNIPCGKQKLVDKIMRPIYSLMDRNGALGCSSK